MNPSPLILVSNDDGITSPGIFRLISLMRGLGEVVVVAPNKPQSGMGPCDYGRGAFAHGCGIFV